MQKLNSIGYSENKIYTSKDYAYVNILRFQLLD